MQLQPQDSRAYFMLPQAPEGAGYYVYGTPDRGAGQYAHPMMLTVLLFVEREWQAGDHRKFGIGNISLAGGSYFDPHESHLDGLQVDVRPLRIDGAHVPVKYFQSGYDQPATKRLIDIFQSHPMVKQVYFNDLQIPGVKSLIGHDNHFHVELRTKSNETVSARCRSDRVNVADPCR